MADVPSAMKEKMAGMAALSSEFATVNRARPEDLLDTQQLVVLGDTIRAAQRTGLDLAGIRGHRDVRDGGILGFARAMADDRRVAVFLRKLHTIKRLGERADLVHRSEEHT